MKRAVYEICKGDIVLVSSGSYSNYGINAVVRALTDFNFRQVEREFLANHPIERAYDFNTYEFIAWMVKVRLAEDLQYRECHFDDYRNEWDMLKKGEA